MKKMVPVCLAFFLLSSCSPKQEKVKKIVEDSVEVVLNNLEPYKIKGEPTALVIEEEFKIDLEREDLAKLGLTDVAELELDSEGNIYFLNWPAHENCVFKFGPKGNFVSSFGRKGQRPGEIQFILSFEIDSLDRITLSDQVSKRIVSFDKDGNLIKETLYGTSALYGYPLENGKYLAQETFKETSINQPVQKLLLCNSEWKNKIVLDSFVPPGNPFIRPNPLFFFKATKDNIYVGNEDRGYEILVYDLEGKLLRKIRKDYRPQLYFEEFKKEKHPFDPPNYSFPKFFPPYNSFFVDEKSRLYVMTYEKGMNSDEYIHDIFNSEGVSIITGSHDCPN